MPPVDRVHCGHVGIVPEAGSQNSVGFGHDKDTEVDVGGDDSAGGQMERFVFVKGRSAMPGNCSGARTWMVASIVKSIILFETNKLSRSVEKLHLLADLISRCYCFAASLEAVPGSSMALTACELTMLPIDGSDCGHPYGMHWSFKHARNMYNALRHSS